MITVLIKIVLHPNIYAEETLKNFISDKGQHTEEIKNLKPAYLIDNKVFIDKIKNLKLDGVGKDLSREGIRVFSIVERFRKLGILLNSDSF
ncbi:hypothetical protein BpHYR1_053154 [Brachionus plicatilis]|uniref:Uncharacterized protein n=1 Tax=Brachionus plicatilis TaxID=10195 RepID=A0A3M7QCQ4_BRAPC|nr:hypothetical protein BpHYR1_053154 [Brachionus plicatilis]